MRRHLFTLVALSLASTLASARNGSAQDPIKTEDAAIEVQARGVLHEAYAQPFEGKPLPGPLVPKEPPPAIPEEPPEQRPDNEAAKWMPGYWAYDAQKQEFMWVSGVYRVPPQGRTFMPGYWQNTPEGWRWINGFWADAAQPELPYTPEPPAPLDNGPSLPPPDDNSTYIPGVWVYRDSRFIWRPGFYAPVRVGRVWHPPYYLWTPNGYLFIDGYWDYPFEDRGLIFAPVYFNRPLWRTAGWRYQPSFVVGFDAFFDSCFVGNGGFYFGNYYDPFYSRHGYRPWYQGRGRYDPVFAYHGWHNHRNNPNWIGGVQTTYAGRSAGRIAAPPLTFAQQSPKTPRVVTPINQFTSKQVTLVKSTPQQLETQRTFAKETQRTALNRSQLDAAPVFKSDPPKTFRAGETKSPNFRPPTTTGVQGKGGTPGAKGGKGPGIVTSPRSTDVPRTVTQPPIQPKTTSPAPKSAPPVQPKSTTPPPPRVTTPPPPPPRTSPPPSRPAPPPPRPSPPPSRPSGKKVSIEASLPSVVTKSAPAPKAVAAPSTPRVVSSPAPRVQSTPAPRVQSAPARSAPPRVSAPPPRSNPPARSSPPANAGKKR